MPRSEHLSRSPVLSNNSAPNFESMTCTICTVRKTNARQLYLGVFDSKKEAMQVYEDALCREAVKQRSSVLRMPKRR